MKLLKRPTTWTGLVGLGVLIVFVIWYRGGQAPLSAEEQADYLAQLQQLTGVSKDFVNLEATREFMRTDDGKPFYVINVFKFREQADYGETAVVNASTNASVTGFEAFKQFRAAVLPIWIKYGTHPVFASTLSESFANDWDLVSVVRYRSRRDFVDIQLNDEIAAILPHRIASAEANIRIKLPGLQIPPPLMLFIIGWVMLLVISFLVERLMLAPRSQ